MSQAEHWSFKTPMVVTPEQHALALGILDSMAETALEPPVAGAVQLVVNPTMTKQITTLMQDIWKASKKPK